MRPIEPTSMATISLATGSRLTASPKAVCWLGEDEQDGERGAGVGEHERVDGRAEVVAPDDHGFLDQLATVNQRVRAAEREHGGGLRDGDVVEDAEGADDDPGEH